jgi:hypothetical protein
MSPHDLKSQVNPVTEQSSNEQMKKIKIASSGQPKSNYLSITTATTVDIGNTTSHRLDLGSKRYQNHTSFHPPFLRLISPPHSCKGYWENLAGKPITRTNSADLFSDNVIAP